MINEFKDRCSVEEVAVKEITTMTEKERNDFNGEILLQKSILMEIPFNCLESEVISR